MNEELYSHNFQSPIKLISNNPKAKDELWVLFNYGNLFLKRSDGQYYRNVEFVKTSKLNYKIENWNIDERLTGSIPEIWSLLYPMGTIFNDQGLPVLYPKRKKKGELYEYDIILSNSYNYKDNSYIEILKNTNYPIPSSFNTTNNPFFLFETKHIQYIIPIDVIKRTFYYRSYSGITSIIHRKLDQGLRNFHTIEDVNTVEYDSNYLLKNDVQSIAKFAFTKEHPSIKESGLSRLKSEVKNFYIRSLNQHTYNDIYFKLPFSQPLSLKVLGQFITDFNTTNNKKFIVYQILKYSPYKDQEELYTTKNIKAFDKNDKTSTNRRDLKDEIEVKSVKVIKDKNKYDSLDIDATNATNSSMVPLNVGLFNDIIFDHDISVEFIKREDQRNKYKTIDGVKTKRLSTLGSNHNISNSDSDIEKFNVIKSDMEPLNQQTKKAFSVFFEGLKHLQDKGVETNIITVNSSERTYSFIKSKWSSKILRLLIVRLNYGGKEYCVIDASEGYSIGIFHNSGNNLQTRDDQNLQLFLQYMINECKFRWSSCFYSDKIVGKEDIIQEKKKKFYKILHSHRFQVLTPMDHLSKPLEENSLSLAKRIFDRIKQHCDN